MPSLRTKENPLGTMDSAALERELEEAIADADINGAGSMELLLSQRLGLEATERGGSGQTALAQHWDKNSQPARLFSSELELTIGIDPSAGMSDPFAIVILQRNEADEYLVISRQLLLKQTFEAAPKGLKKLYNEALAVGELTLCDTASEIETKCHEVCLQYMAFALNVHVCGDPAGLSGFKERFEGAVGTQYTSVAQNWTLKQALEFAGGLAHDGRLIHIGQPLLTANVKNLILENDRMKKFDAGKSGIGHAKIDGCMSMLSAIQVASQKRVWDVGCMIADIPASSGAWGRW
jgi:phage terminase large subunit-like protein